MLIRTRVDLRVEKNVVRSIEVWPKVGSVSSNIFENVFFLSNEISRSRLSGKSHVLLDAAPLDGLQSLLHLLQIPEGPGQLAGGLLGRRDRWLDVLQNVKLEHKNKH